MMEPDPELTPFLFPKWAKGTTVTHDLMASETHERCECVRGAPIAALYRIDL